MQNENYLNDVDGLSFDITSATIQVYTTHSKGHCGLQNRRCSLDRGLASHKYITLSKVSEAFKMLCAISKVFIDTTVLKKTGN